MYSGGAVSKAAPGRGWQDADQRERIVEGVVVHSQALLEAREVAVRHGLQVLARDPEREIAAGRGRPELRELQADALGHRAGPDAGRVERLQEGEHPLDVRFRHRQVGAQAARDVGRAVREVAVVVQRVHQRLADPYLARIEPAHLELPDQVLVQVAIAVVAELERPVVVVLRAAVAGRCRRLGPRVLHLDHDLV